MKTKETIEAAATQDLPPRRAASPPPLYERTANQCKQPACGRRERSAAEEIKEERAKKGGGAESYEKPFAWLKEELLRPDL